MKCADVFTVAVLALALAACGSTVRGDADTAEMTLGTPPAAQAAPAAPGAPAASADSAAPTATTGAPGAAAPAGGGVRPAVATASESGQATGGADGGSATARPAAPSPAAAPAVAAPSSPAAPASSQGGDGAQAPADASGFGFTATEAYLGVEYSSDFDSAAASLGFAITSGDARALTEEIVGFVNSSGGVQGRTLVPVYHDTSTMESDPATSAEATCADFTEDHAVFAGVVHRSSIPCMVAAGVPSSSTGSSTAADEGTVARTNGLAYYPTAYDYGVLIPRWLDRLQALDYFGAAPTIGLLYEEGDGDNQDSPRIAERLKEELARRGLAVVQEFAYSANTLPGNAVLPFAAAGVTHVMSLEAGVALFMVQAESQGYRPRYAVNSYHNIASVLSVIPPKEQLRGTVGAGWEPVNDLVDAPEEYAQVAGYPSCRQFIDASQEVTSPTALFILVSYCDSIRLFLHAAEAGGGLGAGALHDGMARAGQQFPSALSFLTAYDDRQTLGARGLRDIAFDDGCQCFRYLSADVR